MCWVLTEWLNTDIRLMTAFLPYERIKSLREDVLFACLMFKKIGTFLLGGHISNCHVHLLQWWVHSPGEYPQVFSHCFSFSCLHWPTGTNWEICDNNDRCSKKILKTGSNINLINHRHPLNPRIPWSNVLNITKISVSITMHLPRQRQLQRQWWQDTPFIWGTLWGTSRHWTIFLEWKNCRKPNGRLKAHVCRRVLLSEHT